MIVVDNTTIDYSRPIVVAAPAAGVAADPSSVESQAAPLLDAARSAFSNGDYVMALSRINLAITKKPNDPVLHEFRALVLFAMKDFKQSAAAVYAVLSVGPGWDWTTLSGFYPDVNVYTAQLRALEQYRNEHLTSPEGRFLLAYHYMSCGHSAEAATELKEVVRLNPKDQLSAQLLASLTADQSGTAPPAAATPAATTPAKPVDAAGIVGDWTTTRSDGATISLKLAAGSTYTWKYVQQGRTQEFSGAYSVSDNLLILKQNGNPTMVGQVSLLDGDKLNFKLVGNNASDPGLTFSKK